MSNILITGHRGFIGSKLTSKLKDTHHKLFFLESSLIDKNSTKEEVNKIKNIDTLVFLVGGFGNNLQELINVNVLTLSNCLESLKDLGLKNVIFASTGAVYGEPINQKSYEGDELLPTSLYGLSKKYSEDLLKYYFKNKNLNIIVLRFPNVYGSGNQKGVVFNFIESIKIKKSVLLEGDGSEKRNFLFIDDAVTSIIISLKKFDSNSHTPSFFDVINISDEKLYSIKDFISILKNLGLSFEIKKSELSNQNTIKTLSLDNQKMRELLDWSPEVSFEQGITKILEESKYK